jgi:predicted GNAT family acetyltransferase
MPQLSDKAQIRAILETERPWAVYALGDLDPGFFENSSWFGLVTGRPAVALLYTAFPIPLLIFVGGAQEFRPILDEMTSDLCRFQEIYAVVKPDALALLQERYRVQQKREMYRMILDPARYVERPINRAARLGRGDIDALRRLFLDGEASGEAPEWFTPEMLDQRTYFGIFEQGELIAAGGTHVLSANDGVAGLGNIYTRRDRRGRGLGAEITRAIVNRLLTIRIRMIALNVRSNNDVAVRLYERLGFRQYCSFYEAIVVTCA